MKMQQRGVGRARILACALSSIVAILWTGPACALPALSCQTVSIRDPEGIVAQLGKSELALSLKDLSLTYVAEPTAADVSLEFEFFSASGRIVAKLRTWTESEPQLVESGTVRWHEDFAARRRVIEPLEKTEAEGFRAQLVVRLKALLDRHVSAIALGSEPEGLMVTVDRPIPAKLPFARERTVALLGCLSEGEEVAGSVVWPDGHREAFKERASQTPGRRVLRRSTVVPQASASSADENEPEELVRIEQALDAPSTKARAKPKRRAWAYVGFALVTLIVGAVATFAWLRQSRRK